MIIDTLCINVNDAESFFKAYMTIAGIWNVTCESISIRSVEDGILWVKITSETANGIYNLGNTTGFYNQLPNMYKK